MREVLAAAGVLLATPSMAVCTSMAAYQHLSPLDPGSFSLSVMPDHRSQAGVAPAVVVTVQVPTGQKVAALEGGVELRGGGVAAPLTVSRSEYWVMGPTPRVAQPVQPSTILRSQHTEFRTMHRSFYRVPEDAPQEFTVHIRSVTLGGEAVAVPPLRFNRLPGGTRVVLCAEP